MSKIALFKSDTNLEYYEDYHRYLIPVVSEWVEVDDKEYLGIKEAVSHHNYSRNSKEFYVIVEESSIVDEMPILFKNVKEFKEKQEALRLKEERKKAEEKAKRDDKALERKKKQLEKLKKELEE